uniref:Uncharacterized protein n=1 Tax=Oryzias latipes TaxID=8090 RepID=A0A3P9JAG6_ORYLA
PSSLHTYFVLWNKTLCTCSVCTCSVCRFMSSLGGVQFSQNIPAEHLLLHQEKGHKQR